MLPPSDAVGRRAALCLLAAAAVSGCAGSPPIRLYHLKSEPPLPAAPGRPLDEPWQLLLPVRLPEYLDREAILLPEGRTGLLALSGHRWAEALRDAVPRVLRSDLTVLLGEGRVWTAPLPPGLRAARQLRVDIAALEVDADRQAVRLQASWTLVDPRGGQPPRVASVALRVAAEGGSVDGLVAAHRLALWRLAERIALDR